MPRPPNLLPLRVTLLALLCVPVLLTAGAQRSSLTEAMATIRTGHLHARMAFLADDLLEGRAPGTRGGALASRYIASEMQRIGLRPAAPGYLQPVTLVGTRLDTTRAFLRAGARRTPGSVRFELGQEAVIWRGGEATPTTVEAPLVFVGYGVHAPEYAWDDFEDYDVRGKVLLALVNDPPAPPAEPDRFEGRALTYYGRWTYKLEEARRRGAVGVLLVHTPGAAGYDWSVVRNSWSGERFFLPRDTALPAPLALEGWLSGPAARRLLRAADLDLGELFVRAARRDFRPVETSLTIQAALPGRLRRVQSANVAGLLPGSDSLLMRETVVYMAHWDHLGIGPAVGGDSIYNGAYDNASGVALLLELAEAFAVLEPAPARSILFLATTAEEAGLLGSEAYLRAPLRSLRGTVAALNVDGANLWGETEDLMVLGGTWSTLGGSAAVRARGQGLRLTFDRAPELGLAFRSDHFPFARAGVPALGLGHGLEYRGRPTGWGERQLLRYDSAAYHQPGDEYDPGWDLRGAVQQGRLAFLLGWDVATTAERPAWDPDAPFQRPPAPRPSGR
ncbi:MAG: M28 family peptidase [Gemmatimonadota bacterium]